LLLILKSSNFIVLRMRTCITILFFLAAGIVHSQQLAQVTLTNARSLAYFSILTEQDVLVRITEDGKIMEWGTEILSDRGNYYAQKLQPFLARVEYYDAGADSAYKGKVKSIGTTNITYYDSYEEPTRRGKLKRMGMMNFDYYSMYDDKGTRGKLKFTGDLLLDYYGSYEEESVRGKLKSIGNIPITWVTVFDDRYNAGKIKSAGSVSYQWYSQYDLAHGGLKSNNYRTWSGGILFILR
jgi:hypothetical protein